MPFDITGFQDQRLKPLGHLSPDETAKTIIAGNWAVVNAFVEKIVCGVVRASNLGKAEPSENRQGKGGDLRSKYDRTLTVARKTQRPCLLYNAPMQMDACSGDPVPKQVILWSLD